MTPIRWLVTENSYKIILGNERLFMKIRSIASLFLKLIVVLASGIGIFLCCMSESGFMGTARVFLYFTTQSNIWIGLTCLIGIVWMLKNKEKGYVIRSKAFLKAKFMFTVAIFLTGFAFCFLLAPVFPGNPWVLSQILVHVVVPVVALVDFFVGDCSESCVLSYKDSLLTVIPPFYYICFAAVGFVQNWDFGGQNYPYFFLNWGSPLGAFGVSKELPFLGTVWWILVMIVLMIGVGAGMVKIGRGRNKTK